MEYKPQLFMWQDRVLYLGPSYDPALHKHHAVQLCIGIDSQFQIALHGESVWQPVRGALIDSGVAHQISSNETNMAFLYLENETSDYQNLIQLSSHTKSVALKSCVEEACLDVLNEASSGCSELQAKQVCNEILSIFGIDLSKNDLIDPRIVRVLQKLDQTPDGQCESKELEAIACLSASRLQHLFREQVGVPIRRYSLWLRLRRVMAQAIEGDTLMEAAHSAGFSDSSHFSRLFKEMFGIAPSVLFSAGSPVELHLCKME